MGRIAADVILRPSSLVYAELINNLNLSRFRNFLRNPVSAQTCSFYSARRMMVGI